LNFSLFSFLGRRPGRVLSIKTDGGQRCCRIIKILVVPVQVTYNVDGFLEKNRDTLSDSIMRCMRHADASLVYELFSPLSEFGQLEVRYDQLQADLSTTYDTG